MEESTLFTNDEISSFLCKKLEKRHGISIRSHYIDSIDIGDDGRQYIMFSYFIDIDDVVRGERFFYNEITLEMRKSMPKIKIAAKKNNVQSEEINLESTVNDLGKYVTQILHFSGGNKRTVKGVISSSMKEGTLTKFMVKKGYMVMVNINNVDMIEVFTEK